MAKYETVAVFSVKAGEEKAKELVEKFKALIEANGTIESIDEWGKRKLAFPVNKLQEGDYTLINFHADPTQIAELDRVLRINDAVQRHMIVCREDAKKSE